MCVKIYIIIQLYYIMCVRLNKFYNFKMLVNILILFIILKNKLKYQN
jgi:hypothetical protein